MTAMNNPFEAYRQNQYQTATQGELLLMLYRGALDKMEKAKEAIDDNDILNSHQHLIRTQKIVLELMSSVDLENGGKMAQNLFNIYEYMHRRLVRANVKKDREIVEEVEGQVRSLLEAWENALSGEDSAGAGAQAGSNAGAGAQAGSNAGANPYAGSGETSSISFKG